MAADQASLNSARQTKKINVFAKGPEPDAISNISW